MRKARPNGPERGWESGRVCSESGRNFSNLIDPFVHLPCDRGLTLTLTAANICHEISTRACGWTGPQVSRVLGMHNEHLSDHNFSSVEALRPHPLCPHSPLCTLSPLSNTTPLPHTQHSPLHDGATQLRGVSPSSSKPAAPSAATAEQGKHTKHPGPQRDTRHVVLLGRSFGHDEQEAPETGQEGCQER